MDRTSPAEFPSSDNLLLEHGSWRLYRDPQEALTPAAAFLHQTLMETFPFVVDRLQATWPLPHGIEALVILGGDQTALDWSSDGDGDTLGFHALLAPGEDDEGEFLDVAEDHRCYLNLEAIARALDDDHDGDYYLSALATLPHEMAHVALFARHTLGATPLEVFDGAADGQGALQKVLNEMEEGDTAEMVDASLNVSHWGASEDIVEAFGLATMDAWNKLGGLRSLAAPAGVADTTRSKPFRR